MAKLIYGPMLTAASGSIGGTVFMRGTAGPAARARIAPVQPRTISVLAARSYTAYLARLWRTLTDAQRREWKFLAKEIDKHDSLGQLYHPSGFGLFVGHNQTRRLLAEAFVLVPPALDIVPVVDSLSLTAVAQTTLNLAYAGSSASASTRWFIYAASARSQGQGFYNPREFNWIQSAVGNVASPISILTLYNANVGGFRATERVSVQMRGVSANRWVGPPYTATAIST